eukprot:6760236-Prymnesium_polylepis.1
MLQVDADIQQIQQQQIDEARKEPKHECESECESEYESYSDYDGEERRGLEIEEATDGEHKGAEEMEVETAIQELPQQLQIVARQETAVQQNIRIATQRRNLMMEMFNVGLPIPAAMAASQNYLWKLVTEQRANQREQAYQGAAPSYLAKTMNQVDNTDALGM